MMPLKAPFLYKNTPISGSDTLMINEIASRIDITISPAVCPPLFEQGIITDCTDCTVVFVDLLTLPR